MTAADNPCYCPSCGGHVWIKDGRVAAHNRTALCSGTGQLPAFGRDWEHVNGDGPESPAEAGALVQWIGQQVAEMDMCLADDHVRPVTEPTGYVYGTESGFAFKATAQVVDS